MKAQTEGAFATTCPAVVLDSNVVLDLWFFADPRGCALRQAVEGGRLRWVATPALLEELQHVLAQRKVRALVKVGANEEQVFRAFSVWSQPLGRVPAATHHRLRCTDADDQKFIDLALTLAPAWLITRDKAVLKLAKRALGLGVRIATPEQWRAAATSAAAAGDRPSGA